LVSGNLTDDYGTAGRDDFYGFGLINAAKSVVAAKNLAGGAAIPGVLISTPTELNFSFEEQSLTFTVSNGGETSVAVTGFSDDAGWLSVTQSNVDSQGLGEYQASVDRTNLEDGLYSANIQFIVSSGKALNLPVKLQVSSQLISGGNAGLLYFLLFSSDQQLVDQLAIGTDTGDYAYQFLEIAEGDYFIITGSDHDNDKFVCDPGEVCGVYSDDKLQSILIDKDVSDLNFSIKNIQSFDTQTSAFSLKQTTQGFPLNK
jgi:serine protease